MVDSHRLIWVRSRSEKNGLTERQGRSHTRDKDHLRTLLTRDKHRSLTTSSIQTAIKAVFFIYNRSSKMSYFIYTSHHFTPHGRYELNELTSLPMCGSEPRTGNAERSRVRIPLKPWFFFQASSFQLLKLEQPRPQGFSLRKRVGGKPWGRGWNWKIYCDDHSSLSKAVFVTPLTLTFDVSKVKSKLPAYRTTPLSSVKGAHVRWTQSCYVFDFTFTKGIGLSKEVI